MAKFVFNPEEISSKTTTNQDGPKVEFLNKFLKNDGDSVIVRFPYATIGDFDVYHCHRMSIPGYQWQQNVMCGRSDLKHESVQNCPLCMNGEEITDRFVVKAIAYVADSNNQVCLLPVVWDRPKPFVYELTGKLAEYGDLSQHLFKIKRTGTGTSTKYSIDIVINKQVYPDSIYVRDLSAIENLTDPGRLCIKSMNKYLELTGQKEQEEVPQQHSYPTYVHTAQVATQPEVVSTSVPQAPVTNPVSEQPPFMTTPTPVVQQPVPQVPTGNAQGNPFVTQPAPTSAPVAQQPARGNRFRTF